MNALEKIINRVSSDDRSITYLELAIYNNLGSIPFVVTAEKAAEQLARLQAIEVSAEKARKQLAFFKKVFFDHNLTTLWGSSDEDALAELDSLLGKK